MIHQQLPVRFLQDFSKNSETFASEFRKNLEEMLHTQ